MQNPQHPQTLAETEMPSHALLFGFFAFGTVLTYFGTILVGARRRYVEIRDAQQLAANMYVASVAPSHVPQNTRSNVIDRLISEKRLSESQIDSMIVPEHLKCKGTGKLMRDPVCTLNGDTFDRTYIEQYLQDNNNMDPNGNTLASNLLIPDIDIRRQILEAIEQHAATLQTQNNVSALTYLANISSASSATLRDLRASFLDKVEQALGVQERPRF